MKKVLTAILSAVSAVCMTIGVSACDAPVKEYNSGRKVVTDFTVDCKGKWNEYDGIKYTFAESPDISDGEVYSDMDFELNKTYYLIADVSMQAEYDNDGTGTMTATFAVSPVSAVEATLQEASTGNFSELTADDAKKISVSYQIPQLAGSTLTQRIIIRFIPKTSSEVNITINFDTNNGMTAVKTPSVSANFSVAYTKGLTYRIAYHDELAVWRIGNAKDYKTLVIPKYYMGHRVRSIGDSAFAYKTEIETLILPDSIKNIDFRAFEFCKSLQNVCLPEGITTINQSAFSGCYALKSITLPTGIKSVYENAFSSCTSLQNVSLPDTLTSISTGAFDGCTALESITIPQKVKSIGNYAFSGCTALKSVLFENTEKWTIYKKNTINSYTPVSSEALASPEKAAQLLSATYSEWVWIN